MNEDGGLSIGRRNFLIIFLQITYLSVDFIPSSDLVSLIWGIFDFIAF